MGGGAAGYVVNCVSVRRTAGKLDPMKFVYQGRGSGHIKVEWISDRDLVIESPMETVFFTPAHDEVRITLKKP
jgi:hypothetical protein